VYRFNEEFIDSVREAVDIIDLVSDYVALRKSGKRFKGLCPFHTEKTPSFTVSPESGLYYCYGCHRGGNAFNFLMEIEGLSFPETVRQLARRVGITVPMGDNLLENDLISLNRWACDIFHDTLVSSRTLSNHVLRYLEKRKIRRECIEKFKLGHAPNQWEFIVQKAHREKIPTDLLKEAGLILPRRDGSGYVDRFRNRLIFPLLSPAGEVLGFAGRVLPGNNDKAKYVNSPETPLYKKSQYIYGLHAARKTIKDSGTAYLMEGYFDVIQAHQHGFTQSICVSGTALTTEQVHMLARRIHEITLLFDGDAPGISAAERAVALLLHGGISSSVVLFPEDQDPDSILVNDGAKGLERHVENSVRDIDYLVQRSQRETGSQSRSAVHRLMPIISGIPDPLLKEEAASDIARIFGYSKSAIMNLLDSQKTTSKIKRDKTRERSGSRSFAWEEQLIRYVLIHPLNREDVYDELRPDDFHNEQYRLLFRWIQEHGGHLTGGEIVSRIDSPEINRCAVELMMSDTPLAPFEHLLARARFEKLEKSLRRLKGEMRAAEEIGDTERVTSLAKQIQEMSAIAEGLKPAMKHRPQKQIK